MTLEFIAVNCACLGLPGLPGGKSLFFASPKKSNQKKRRPCSSSLRFATGTLRCSEKAGSRANSLRSNRHAPLSAFSCPPHLLSKGLGGRIWAPNSFSHPVLAGLEKVGGGGLKNLDVRRRHSRLVSRFSSSFSFFKEPRSGPDCGSPFLLLTFLLAIAKRKVSCRRATPGIRNQERLTAINLIANCAQFH